MNTTRILALACAVAVAGIANGTLAQNSPATAPADNVAPARGPAPGGPAARGGNRGRGGFGQPAAVSPEVHADKTVTLRLRAPNAQTVTLTGDINSSLAIAAKSNNTSTPISLSKDQAGTWSVTVGPLAPAIYNYAFNVDGLRIADSSNPDIKGTSESMVTVPGDTPMPWELRNVPHGKVAQFVYDSKAIGMQRRFYIYTPPGYESGSDKLPVLYLLHGYTDDDSGWTVCGKANLIMDNLLADKKAKPAIIVMPYGQLSSRTTVGDALGAAYLAQYENQILNEIIPYIESNYRATADSKHRARAGRSMGGFQTVTIGMNHPEIFGSIGAWSAAGINNPASVAAKLAAAPDNVKHGFQYVHLGCGEQDNLITGTRGMDQWLTSQGIAHDLRAIPGVHSWLVWRVFLSEFLPKFTEAAAKS